MKIIDKIVYLILAIILLIGLIALGIVGWFNLSVYVYEKEMQKKYKMDEPINRPVFDEYIKNTFGIVGETFTDIKYLGIPSGRVGGNTGGQQYHRGFTITTPFISKPFEVWIDNRTHKVFGDNFYEVLSTDEKFQHLYSDWVKKQIGCEDANVEFTFVGNFDKVQINFKNITKLSDNNIEIFENTKNFYSWLCKVRNIKNLGDNNKIIVAEKIRNEYLLKAMRVTGIPKDISKKYNGHIQLSNGKFDRVKDINYEFVFDVRDMKYEINERKY